MAKRDEPFRPEKVDEQLSQLLAQAASRSTKPVEPEMRLIQDLHSLHADDTQSGERVWARLAEQLGEQNVAPHYLHILTNHPLPKERISISMQIPESNTIQSQPFVPPRQPRHIFSLVAAVLVAALLIGSAAWVFTAPHALQQNTGTARSGQTTLPSSSVKKVVARNCVSFGDPAWDRTCQAGLVQALSQSHKLSDGQTFALKGIFADRSQIAIWYSLKPQLAKGTLVAPNITLTAQGKDLPMLNAIGVPGPGVSHPNGPTQWLSHFDASNLPAALQTVQLKLTSQVIAMTPGRSPTLSNAATFTFSVPLAASRVIIPTPSQAVTANGITLTLKSVAISRLGITFVLASSKPLSTLERNTNEAVNNVAYSTLVAGSVQLDSRNNTGSSRDLTTDGNKHSPVIGAAFTFGTDLTDQHGSWTFTVSIPGQSQSWVFHVTA